MRTAGDIAKVSAAVMMTVDGNTCRDARIVLGAVAPTVLRARKSEAVFKGNEIKPEVIAAAASAAAEEAKPITDIRSTAEYRKEMVGILVRRAIEKALERAKV